MEMDLWTQRAQEAAWAVQQRSALAPRVGIILGSGLGDVVDAVAPDVRIRTGDLPHLASSTVVGHAGELVIGSLSGVPVAVLAGRTHLYEGYPPAQLGLPIRMLAALGCQELIVTNAAGALNPCFRPGEIMVIDDHVSLPSLAGLSPLVGVAPTGGTPRFVDLSGAYSRRLAALADVAAEANGQSVRHGVYVMVGGPNFETPAEVRFLQHLGDAVGMSTVPEVIVARQLGLEVLGVSILSNLAAGLPGALLEHEDVLRVVGQTAPVVGQLIQSVLRRIGA